MRQLVIAASAALLGLAAQAASAQSVSPVVITPDPDARSAVVAYADLNLETEPGRQALGARLRFAAHQVCGERSKLLRVESSRRACFNGAMADAWGQVAAIRSGPALAQRPTAIRISLSRR